MILINIPDNNQQERKYIIRTIFGAFLGLSYQVIVKPSLRNINIKLDNNNAIFFEDHFFNNFSTSKSYLQKANLPKETKAAKNFNQFSVEKNTPIVFGRDYLHVTDSKITCGIDIFASSFFMLTRWEEYVNSTRDEYNRFPGSASTAVKNDFIQRPIVNEYLEMLWNMLVHLGINQKRKKRKFQAIISHDVDLPLLWKNPISFIKKIGGDLVKRNSIKDAAYSFKSYKGYISGKSKDPYDTFEELMALSENCGLKSHFFFLCGGQHKEDGSLPLSHPFMKNLFKKINDRAHVIGFHPSFDSYNSPNIFSQELQELQEASTQTITCGRQHFLRFEVPRTWRLWEAVGMDWESSMYYPDAPGFRCGTCYGFPVFDILERKELRLREVPLVAMEVSWNSYKEYSPEKMYADLNGLVNTVKKYNGIFPLLWHNSSFNTTLWRKFKPVYSEVLKLLKAESN